MHELALEFLVQGHSVTVLTPAILQRKKFEIEFLDGVRILRFSSGRIKNVNKIVRLINEFLLSFRAWRSFRKWFSENPNDLIVYYSPSIFWAPIVEKLVKLWSSDTYLILRDFFPQWAIDSGLISETSLIAKFFQYYERRTYRVANRIGVMSPANLRWFVSRFPMLNNVEVLYNWTSAKQFEPKHSLRSEYLLMDKVIFLYGGNIGHAQYMKNLLDLAFRFRIHKEVFFVFIGSGDEENLVKETIEGNGLSNCLLLESVPQDIFESYLTEADVGLFTLHPNHKTHNFPGKILGYVQMGLPILGAVNRGNDLKELINETGSGLICDSGDSESLFSNATKLLNPELRKYMGKCAKQLLYANFSTSAAAAKIINSGSNK
ncbi:glycosyltransferase, group 1 family protein [Leptospira wolbachii serovar Codice str. CDC]|uniref:Glycosyltransferase, group 1 family protein n=2 Tax=Leptospira TaxID=171 RepID=R9A759_9LEPT|nr:glycosyltransferase, group 1 family protein [Leptospira wolbachii serovar Codice str. CDC]